MIWVWIGIWTLSVFLIGRTTVYMKVLKIFETELKKLREHESGSPRELYQHEGKLELLIELLKKLR